MRRATVLVTGATGFIGSHLVEYLLPRAAQVRCLVRRSSSFRYLPALAVELHYGDLVSGEGLRPAADGADIVIHLAGVTKALRAKDYYAGNVRATENLARACAAVPRLVHVSTLAAVGPSLDGTPLTEDADPHPPTHYGKSKLQGERTVRELAPHAVIVRPPVVYGPRDTDVYRMFLSARRGIELSIGREDCWFSAIYVKDLVAGLAAAAESPAAAGNTYFLAHPEPVSWRGFFATAAGLLDRKSRRIVLPAGVAYAAGWMAELWSQIRRKPGIISRDKVTEARCRYWTCDPRRAARDLGFQASTSLAEGVQATLAWYKESKWL
jgi:nucleoside-diphosphate-sugar epimerase